MLQAIPEPPFLWAPVPPFDGHPVVARAHAFAPAIDQRQSEHRSSDAEPAWARNAQNAA